MKIAVLGATGYIGRHIVNELAQRNHQLHAVSRHISSDANPTNIATFALDIENTTALSTALAGCQAVVLSTKYVQPDGLHILELLRPILIASQLRLVVIGGAGSLRTASGMDLVDSPEFPLQWKADALAARKVLQTLRNETNVNWSYASPSALLQPGARTGQFRIGGDTLLVDGNGKSSISLEDFAMAVANEIEDPRHIRRRFTVGY